MSKPDYRLIVDHYERCFAEHGPNAKGMDWPNYADLRTRFAVMLALANGDPRTPIEILDLGCGVGLLLEYLENEKLLGRYRYRGIDLSEKMIESARRRYPDENFETRDILRNPVAPQSFDYVVMNGILTERVSLGQEAMEQFAQDLIEAAYLACRRGIAFNVMNSHVDWERDDLFHWPFDRAAAFLKKRCSRHIVIRADYGLYEYTVYVFREPRR